MSKREYMHQWLKKDAVCYDMPTDEIIQQLAHENEELEAELEGHRWIPVSERLPEQKDNSYCSAWVVATDKKTWTIAQYNYEYAHWDKDHSPYDLGMETITHWEQIILPEQLYRYCWGNNEKRKLMKGRICRVLSRGKKNSCSIEFDNGQKEIVSRNSLRKIDG